MKPEYIRKSAEFPIARESREHRPWPASPTQYPLDRPIALENVRVTWPIIGGAVMCAAIWAALLLLV